MIERTKEWQLQLEERLKQPKKHLGVTQGFIFYILHRQFSGSGTRIVPVLLRIARTSYSALTPLLPRKNP